MYRNRLHEKLTEALAAVLPIVGIVLLLSDRLPIGAAVAACKRSSLSHRVHHRHATELRVLILVLVVQSIGVEVIRERASIPVLLEVRICLIQPHRLVFAYRTCHVLLQQCTSLLDDRICHWIMWSDRNPLLMPLWMFSMQTIRL